MSYREAIYKSLYYMFIPDFASFVRFCNRKLGNFSLMKQFILSRKHSLTVRISTYKIRDKNIFKMSCTFHKTKGLTFLGLRRGIGMIAIPSIFL